MSPKFMHTRAAERKPELYRAIRAEQRRRYYGPTVGVYPRRRWEAWEDDMVLDSGLTDRELSQTLERSVKAIEMRRWRLRKGGLRG